MKLILASSVLAAISTAAVAENYNDQIKINVEMSTIESNGMYETIVFDHTAPIGKDLSIVFCSTVMIENSENGVVVSGIDPNTETTSIGFLGADVENVEFEFDGEKYTAQELAENHTFHEAILNSELSSLDEKTANKMLAQLPTGA